MMRQVGKCTLSIHKSLPDGVRCTYVLRYIGWYSKITSIVGILSESTSPTSTQFTQTAHYWANIELQYLCRVPVRSISRTCVSRQFFQKCVSKGKSLPEAVYFPLFWNFTCDQVNFWSKKVYVGPILVIDYFAGGVWGERRFDCGMDWCDRINDWHILCASSFLLSAAWPFDRNWFSWVYRRIYSGQCLHTGDGCMNAITKKTNVEKEWKIRRFGIIDEKRTWF